MAKTSNRYEEEFKEKIAKLHIEKGESIQSIVKQYDISESSVIKWSKEYRDRTMTNGCVDEDDKLLQENMRLKQQVARLDNENRFKRRMIQYLIKEIAAIDSGARLYE